MASIVFDGYTLLRFCGALAILWIVYYLLFDRKARFKHCRYFLLSAVIIAFIAAFIRIPVYPSGRTVVLTTEAWGNPVIHEHLDTAGVLIPVEPLEIKADKEEAEEVLMPTSDWREKWLTYSREINFFLLIYVLVAVGLLLRWIIAVASILRMKKWGSCYCQEDICIVRNNRVSSPFSFFRIIFINRKLEGETLEVVLAHEKSHIEHKHYWDSLFMEMCCILFWFNPFVWLIKRELRALHEFEVDQFLLSTGLELSKYQNIIFDELMGYGPGIANGFHNSLIKKRFIMMKNTYTIRYGLMRKAMLLPLLAGVIVLFAFTEKEKVEDQVLLPAISDVATLDGPVDAREFGNTMQPAVHPLDLKLATIEPKTPLAVAVDTNVADEPLVIENITRQPFKGRDGITFYPLREDQVVVSLLPFDRGRTRVRYIELDKDETRVTIATPIFFDSNWVQFDQGFCIVDRETGDTYMIRSLTRGIELNKTLVVEGKKNRMVEFTMVFPPLKKGVKYVDMYQKFPEMQAPMPTNTGAPWDWKNLKLSNYAPPKDKDLYYDKEGRPIQPRKIQYVELREDQVVESKLPFKEQTTITSIITDKEATRVTIATPIYFDRNWVQFDKGFCLEDCRNGDVYKIKGLARDIELNKTLVVAGKKGKMVEFTMIFPPLKKRAKRVNMYTKYLEESALSPSNGAGEWNWRNIRVADYGGQIYY